MPIGKDRTNAEVIEIERVEETRGRRGQKRQRLHMLLSCGHTAVRFARRSKESARRIRADLGQVFDLEVADMAQPPRRLYCAACCKPSPPG